jgi:hypothetical protein
MPRSVVVRTWNIGRVSLHDPRVQKELSAWTRGAAVDVFILCEVLWCDAAALVEKPPKHYTCFTPSRPTYGWTTVAVVKHTHRARVSWPHHRLVSVELLNARRPSTRDRDRGVDDDDTDTDTDTDTGAGAGAKAKEQSFARIIGMHGYRVDASTPKLKTARQHWFMTLLRLLREQPRHTLLIGDYNYDFRKGAVVACPIAESIVAAPYNLVRAPLDVPTYENHKTNTQKWHGGEFKEQGGEGVEHYRVPPRQLILDHIFATRDMRMVATAQAQLPCYKDLDHRWVGAECVVEEEAVPAAAPSSPPPRPALLPQHYAIAVLHDAAVAGAPDLTVRAFNDDAHATFQFAFARQDAGGGVVVLGPSRGAFLATLFHGVAVFVHNMPQWQLLFGVDFAAQLNAVKVSGALALLRARPATLVDASSAAIMTFSATLLGYPVGAGAAAAAEPVPPPQPPSPGHTVVRIRGCEEILRVVEQIAQRRVEEEEARIDADIAERTRQLAVEAEQRKASARAQELEPLRTLRSSTRKRARIEIEAV